MNIEWTDYMQFRMKLRGYDLARLEYILTYSTERYFDTSTQRHVMIGRYHDDLVMIPFEYEEESIVPVTVHATTRQQINFRVRTGRFIYA